MCIINEPAEVTNTEILVSPNFDNTRQLTVYANKVQTQFVNNAMILPVPYPRTVKLHDLSQYRDIFEDCSKCFSSPLMRQSFANSVLNDSMKSRNILEVYRCGSYQVSVVPSHNDFDLLNRNYFQLNPLVGSILKKYYNSNFGFIVCKLREGSEEKYHPLAYSHQIYKNNLMFVPTRHHHSDYEEKRSHYDHNIYSINTKSLCGSEHWNYQFKLQLQLINGFHFPEIVNFNKLSLKAEDMNTDLYFYLDSYVESFGYCHGIDGCLFMTNHPEITFKNRGSIYTQVFYRGLPFLGKRSNEFNYDRKGIMFAGSGTSFTVIGNKIIVVDDIGTPQERRLEFKFDPTKGDLNPGVYLYSGTLN